MIKTCSLNYYCNTHNETSAVILQMALPFGMQITSIRAIACIVLDIHAHTLSYCTCKWAQLECLRAVAAEYISEHNHRMTVRESGLWLVSCRTLVMAFLQWWCEHRGKTSSPTKCKEQMTRIAIGCRHPLETAIMRLQTEKPMRTAAAMFLVISPLLGKQFEPILRHLHLWLNNVYFDLQSLKSPACGLSSVTQYGTFILDSFW